MSSSSPSPFGNKFMEQIMNYIKSMMGNGGGNGGVHGGNGFPQQPHGMSGSGQLAGMKNKEIAKNLKNNFDFFEDPKKPGYITQERIRDIANSPFTGRFADDRNIQLAQEILKRPDLNRLLDQHSMTGQSDGFIDRKNVDIAIKYSN